MSKDVTVRVRSRAPKKFRAMGLPKGKRPIARNFFERVRRTRTRISDCGQTLRWRVWRSKPCTTHGLGNCPRRASSRFPTPPRQPAGLTHSSGSCPRRDASDPKAEFGSHESLPYIRMARAALLTLLQDPEFGVQVFLHRSKVGGIASQRGGIGHSQVGVVATHKSKISFDFVA